MNSIGSLTVIHAKRNLHVSHNEIRSFCECISCAYSRQKNNGRFPKEVAWKISTRPLDSNILRSKNRRLLCLACYPCPLGKSASSSHPFNDRMIDWNICFLNLLRDLFVNGPPIAPTSIGFFFCLWNEARTFTIVSSSGSSWKTNQGMMMSILGSSKNDCIAN